MRKVLLSLIAAVLVIGLFAAVGYSAYRVGYNQGAQATDAGDTPPFRQFEDFRPRGMPMDNFGRDIERGFNRGFGPGEFPRMGFGFFSPILFLGRIAALGLVLWFIYWLFTRSGWRLTRTPQATAAAPPNTEDENQNAEVNQ
ncbi:MAG TPA: hypothetical protein VGA72_02055 [Anaerolineales bacterium]